MDELDNSPKRPAVVYALAAFAALAILGLGSADPEGLLFVVAIGTTGVCACLPSTTIFGSDTSAIRRGMLALLGFVSCVLINWRACFLTETQFSSGYVVYLAVVFVIGWAIPAIRKSFT